MNSAPENLPPLQMGDAAVELLLSDQRGQVQSLKTWWQQGPLLLVFLRHVGCPLTRGWMEQFKVEVADAAKSHGTIALVTMSTPEQAATFREAQQIPFVCLSDPQQTAYQAYGIPRGTLWQISQPAVWKEGLKGVLQCGVGAVQGDPFQLPGVVLIDTQGIIRFLHRSQHSADWPQTADWLPLWQAISA